MELTKDILIADLLGMSEEKGVTEQVAQELMSIGMHCLGCAMASGETLEQACAVHGADVDALVAKIAAILNK